MTPGFLMSLAIGAQLPVIRAISGSSLASSRWVSSAGFTSTRPATSSGRVSASRIASVPPIDSPATKTRSHSAASASNASFTAVVHWSWVLVLQSCQRVPWPGSSGQRTAKPAAARCSPQGRMLIGVPVKPCTSRTPVRPSGPSPPGKANGSAPGITSSGAVGPGTGVLLGVRRRCRPAERVSDSSLGRPIVIRPPGSLVWQFTREACCSTGSSSSSRSARWSTPSSVRAPKARRTCRRRVRRSWRATTCPPPTGSSCRCRSSDGSPSSPRPSTSPAPGVKGCAQRAFFSGAGQVPIDRSSASAAENAIQTGLRILREGKLLGIYPEGTRSPDGRLFRGKTGVARMALRDRRPRRPGRDDLHARRSCPSARRSPGCRCGSASRWTSPATRGCRVTASWSGRSPTRSCTRS